MNYPLFRAHFANYGDMVLWTPLRKLGRVLVAYKDEQSAVKARREMDGFVWDEDDSNGNVGSPESSKNELEQQPMRVFFGPSIALPLKDLRSTLLDVPQLSRNFLISPPGSPPVGWEQTLEEAPNPNPLPTSSDPTDCQDSAWAEELSRALRFLSTESNPDADDPVESKVDSADESSNEAQSSTTLLVPAAASASRPAVTVSSPSTLDVRSDGTGTPPLPPGAQKIGSVKATIESMLGKKRSFSDLRGAGQDPAESDYNELQNAPAHRTGPARITPTARPPLHAE
ncbi:hypothetical protein OIV83_004525 [Microbotryomycetes sp. JL201]|nr:hypothetical protein OIV83_004525 [Microbotryomycetes sp. JL201]